MHTKLTNTLLTGQRSIVKEKKEKPLIARVYYRTNNNFVRNHSDTFNDKSLSLYRGKHTKNEDENPP